MKMAKQKIQWTPGATFLAGVLVIAGLLVGGGIVGNVAYGTGGKIHPITCIDSDLGSYALSKPGVITITNPDGTVTYPDYCDSENAVMEGICINDDYHTRLEYCRGSCTENKAGIGYCIP